MWLTVQVVVSGSPLLSKICACLLMKRDIKNAITPTYFMYESESESEVTQLCLTLRHHGL